MKHEITITYNTLKINELEPEDLELVEKAKDAYDKAYAPYSNFRVGASLRLSDDSIIIGNNQENAAYPSGLCAERVVLFNAMSNYPDKVIDSIAIYTQAGSTKSPASPCGACRQVMAEYEIRQKKEVRLLLINDFEIIEVKSSLELLPLVFDPQNLSN